MSLLSWKLHGDGKSISSGAVVSTDERLTWPRTIGVGLQHIAAMFGATFLVPIITGFPPTTTLFFSGIGTFVFLIVTKNRVPSYLGSSFAFLAPIAGAMGADKNFGAALGGVVVTADGDVIDLGEHRVCLSPPYAFGFCWRSTNVSPPFILSMQSSTNSTPCFSVIRNLVIRESVILNRPVDR